MSRLAGGGAKLTPQKLDSRSQELLLEIARQALADAVKGQKPSEIELKSLPEDLQADGAAFVTLTIGGDARLHRCLKRGGR